MAWYDSIDLYNKFTTEENYWFPECIQKQLNKSKIPSSINEYISSMIPYDQNICWMPFFSDEEEDNSTLYDQHHPFHRKSTQCSSCSTMNKVFIQPIDELLVFTTPLTKSFGIMNTNINTNKICITANPWIHNVITRSALNDYVKSIVYAYICNSTGVLIEQKSHTKKTLDIEYYLDVFDQVDGFLMAPNENLLDKFNNLYNLECLCWTWEKSKNIRWIGTMISDKTKSIPWIYNDYQSTIDPSTWSGYYMQNKLGEENNTKMDRRKWNEWMIIFSLCLAGHFPSKFNKHKKEWTSPMACIEWLIKQSK